MTVQYTMMLDDQMYLLLKSRYTETGEQMSKIIRRAVKDLLDKEFPGGITWERNYERGISIDEV